MLSSSMLLVVALAHAGAVDSVVCALVDCRTFVCASGDNCGPQRLDSAASTQVPGLRHQVIKPRRLSPGDIILDFEGVGNLNPIGNFYSAEGVFFSANALAVVDADSPGGTGNFGGEPSPDTILFFLSGVSAIMNVPAGFTVGFSFWYSAISNTGIISVHDDLNGLGQLLATLILPLTPFNGAPDPNGAFSPFLPIEIAFLGVARSVSFSGTENQIAFDNIQLGLMSDNVPVQDFFD